MVQQRISRLQYNPSAYEEKGDAKQNLATNRWIRHRFFFLAFIFCGFLGSAASRSDRPNSSRDIELKSSAFNSDNEILPGLGVCLCFLAFLFIDPFEWSDFLRLSLVKNNNRDACMKFHVES